MSNDKNRETLGERLIRLETKFDSMLQILPDIKISITEIQKNISEHYRDIENLKRDVDNLKVCNQHMEDKVDENSKWIQKRDALLTTASASIGAVVAAILSFFRQ